MKDNDYLDRSIWVIGSADDADAFMAKLYQTKPDKPNEWRFNYAAFHAMFKAPAGPGAANADSSKK